MKVRTTNAATPRPIPAFIPEESPLEDGGAVTLLLGLELIVDAGRLVVLEVEVGLDTESPLVLMLK